MAHSEGLQDIEADVLISISELHENKASMLFQVLPAIVQSRMPMLPSLRRSVSEYRTRGSHNKKHSLSELSLPETPPPGYTSRPASGNTTPRPSSVTSASVFRFDDDVSVASPAPITTFETASGISWQHARHGVTGVTEASQQANASSNKLDAGLVTDMIRSQYIYSLTVLLRSLPPKLTPAEQLSLHAVIPQEILDMESRSTGALIQRVDIGDGAQEPHVQTTLECGTAWLVVKLLFFLQIMLPYLKSLLKHAAQFEHDHQITRRTFNASLTVGSDVSRRVIQAVCRLKQGIAGDVISHATVYCAESIAGGIQQGLIESKRSKQTGSQRRKDTAVSQRA